MSKAYAYVRFSTKGQEEGASLSRQLDAARKYAKEHNLTLDEGTYQDRGVSAFKGANLIDGRLGVFIAEVEAGRIPRGSYLLVESLDRISRNVISEAQSLLLRILNLDIIVVTLLDKQVFSKEKYNEDGGMSVLLSLLTMLRAHDESKKKSDRVADGWAAVRDGRPSKPGAPVRKIITKMAPAWLSAKDDRWVVNKERVKVIKRIFSLALANNGSPRIAKILNADRTPTFGKPREQDVAAEWTSGTVAHVLSNKAVVGIYETKKILAREGYFPEIIPKKQFYDVQHAMRARNFAPGEREGSGVANLFSGRSYCGICGAKMKTVSAAGKNVYIHCERAYSGKCEARRVAYVAFEEQFMQWVMEKDLNVFAPTKSMAVDPRPMLMAEIEAKEKELEKLVDYMLDSPKSAVLTKRLSTTEAELAELQDQVRRALPQSTVSDAEEAEQIWETYAYYEGLRDMLESGSSYYGRLDDHRQHVEEELRGNPTLNEGQRDRYRKNLARHHRFVDDFGIDYAGEHKLSEKTLKKIRSKLNELRKEVQMGTRRLVRRIDFHHLPATEHRPDGYMTLKNATYESYRLTLNSGGIYERWYTRPAKGFQPGNRNGK